MKNAFLALALLSLPASAFSAGFRPTGRSAPARRVTRAGTTAVRSVNPAPASRRSSFTPNRGIPARSQAVRGATPQSSAFRGATPSSGGGRTSRSGGFSSFAPRRIRAPRRIGNVPPQPSPAPDPGTPPSTTPPATPPAPGASEPQTTPPWAVPGALIRTEGLGFKQGPGSPARQHTVEAGSSIAAGGARALESQTGIFTGAKDKLPSPNPGTGGTKGGASGRTGITAAGE